MRAVYSGGMDGGYGRQGGGAGGVGGGARGTKSGGLKGARASSMYGHPALKHDVHVVHCVSAHELQPYAVGSVMSVASHGVRPSSRRQKVGYQVRRQGGLREEG